nr:MAG TPA: hypothetical protein [Bacteriophage sp.]
MLHLLYNMMQFYHKCVIKSIKLSALYIFYK